MKNNVNDTCANGYHFALVSRTQSTNGGLRSPSLASVLLLVRNDTLCALVVQTTIADKKQVLAAFLDIKGAYNEVPSDNLLKKFAKIGVSEKTLSFMKFSIYKRSLFTVRNMELLSREPTRWIAVHAHWAGCSIIWCA